MRFVIVMAALVLMSMPHAWADDGEALVIQKNGHTTIVPLPKASADLVKQSIAKGNRVKIVYPKRSKHDEDVQEALEDLEDGYCDKRCRRILSENPARNTGYLTGKILFD